MRDGSSPRRRLGGYELRAKIADGGMAAVYVACPDDGSRRAVAIKMIRDDLARNAEFVTMFTDEAKIVSRLRHANIVEYFELGAEGGQVFLAMELLLGQSLWSVWEVCRSRGIRLRYDVLAWIGARVADGLHYAHELADDSGKALDIVHRDVNATNIFVTFDGHIKVIDFGLAKAANRASRTAAGVIKGKVAYMSPEQAVGAPVDRRTDVFALGTTLWEIACDRRLFKQPDDVETLQRVHAAYVPDPTTWIEGFPPALWRILQRSLARERMARHPTAAELAHELDEFARSSGGGVDGRTVAAVMRELFAEEEARQEAWLADASRAERRMSGEPLKPRSTFWSALDASGEKARPGLTAPTPSRSVGRPAQRAKWAVWVLAVAVALLAVAALVAFGTC